MADFTQKIKQLITDYTFYVCQEYFVSYNTREFRGTLEFTFGNRENIAIYFDERFSVGSSVYNEMDFPNLKITVCGNTKENMDCDGNVAKMSSESAQEDFERNGTSLTHKEEEKLYRCAICNEGFIVKDNLLKHMERHGGLRMSGEFQPAAGPLELLTSMGYSRELATQALMKTGNGSADMAAAWILDHEDAGSDEEVNPLGEDFLDETDFYKMVFVVNSQLKMGVGKVAAQVGHATLGVYKAMITDQNKYGEGLLQWEQFGETKIVLKGTDATELATLASQAQASGLAHYLVHDAGRTQIAAGSVTVLGIMGKNDLVDQITGQLALL